MHKIKNGECRNGKIMINKYLEKQIENFEIEPPIESLRTSEVISEENEKVKNLLKRAVEKEFAPGSLADSIRQGIRSRI